MREFQIIPENIKHNDFKVSTESNNHGKRKYITHFPQEPE